MAHPNIHAESSAKKFGGTPEDYIAIHEWFDETKGWIGHSDHRIFRHHSEVYLNVNLNLVEHSTIQTIKKFTQDMLVSNMLEKIVITISRLQKNGITI